MPDITIGRLRGGYCVSWREDGKRRRYQLKACTRKEAEAEALDVYHRRTVHAGHSGNIERLWQVYIDALAGKPAATTLSYTGKAVLQHFGHFRPDQIDLQLCRDYADIRMRGNKSQGTVHTELGHLKQCMNYAVKIGLIEKAPHIWRPAKPAPKERYLERHEITRLIESAEAHHIRLAIILLLGTAGRIGAILDLEWERVDFERGTINLRLSDSTTRKGRAVVPMNGMTRAALQTAQDAALSDYVVEFAGGRVKSIRTGFTAACRRAEIEGVTIHTLRHTAAVYMAEAGVPMWKISQYLGHSNTAITERVYARYAPSAMQDAADVLNFTELRSAK